MKNQKILSIVMSICLFVLTIGIAVPVRAVDVNETYIHIGASKIYKDKSNDINISLKNNTKTISGVELFIAFDTDIMSVTDVKSLMGNNWEIDYKLKSYAKYGRGVHCMLQDNSLSGFNNNEKSLLTVSIDASKAKLNSSYNLKVYVIDVCDSNGNSIGTSISGDDISLKCVDSSMVDIDILGLQYNAQKDGIRVISMVEPTVEGKKVVEFGHIFGLVTDNLTKEDMYVRTDEYYVRSFAATQLGILSTQVSDSSTATNYLMTIINNGSSVKALTRKYMLRAYAKLEDGSYAYSQVVTFSIYSLAEELYNNYRMPNEAGHNHLYNNILKVVNSNYKEVDYNWSGAIVK